MMAESDEVGVSEASRPYWTRSLWVNLLRMGVVGGIDLERLMGAKGPGKSEIS
ncbi:hypothetical protein MYX82_09765 [Acidobacteria bacterium AH-259-D05]|nr:hypothetical protein [Acidobacteria bacterium AH-259-D05]